MEEGWAARGEEKGVRGILNWLKGRKKKGVGRMLRRTAGIEKGEPT